MYTYHVYVLTLSCTRVEGCLCQCLWSSVWCYPKILEICLQGFVLVHSFALPGWMPLSHGVCYTSFPRCPVWYIGLCYHLGLLPPSGHRFKEGQRGLCIGSWHVPIGLSWGLTHLIFLLAADSSILFSARSLAWSFHIFCSSCTVILSGWLPIYLQ